MTTSTRQINGIFFKCEARNGRGIYTNLYFSGDQERNGWEDLKRFFSAAGGEKTHPLHLPGD